MCSVKAPRLVVWKGMYGRSLAKDISRLVITGIVGTKVLLRQYSGPWESGLDKLNLIIQHGHIIGILFIPQQLVIQYFNLDVCAL